MCLTIAGSKPAMLPMWGVHGELFCPQGKLRDWSRAGYGAGDRPIPRPASFSDLVVDWDAAGDGVTDDTEARSCPVVWCVSLSVCVCVCVCVSVCLCCNLCLLSAAHPCSYCILLPYTACLLVSCLLPLSAVCCLFTSCCLHLHALLLPLCFCLLVRPFLSVLFAFYCLALLPFGQLPFAYLYCLLPRATSSCCLSVTRLLSFCNLCCQL